MKPVRNRKGEVRQMEKADVVMLKSDFQSLYANELRQELLHILNMNDKTAQVYVKTKSDTFELKLHKVKLEHLRLIGTKEVSFKEFYNIFYF